VLLHTGDDAHNIEQTTTDMANVAAKISTRPIAEAGVIAATTTPTGSATHSVFTRARVSAHAH
jgi:hypothetical protein